MAAEVNGGFDRAAITGPDVTLPAAAGAGTLFLCGHRLYFGQDLRSASFLSMVARYLLAKREHLYLFAYLKPFLPFGDYHVAVRHRKGRYNGRFREDRALPSRRPARKSR